jgi:hypothetical protein
MVVWILILIPWVALLALILHDATKDDSDGSAILIAAKNLKALVLWAMQKSVSKPKLASKVISMSSRPGGRGEIKQAPALPSNKPNKPNKQWWRRERRVSMAKPELELAIAEAVKEAAPVCEDFVGVIVGPAAPKAHLDPNWEVRGVKFGTADRKLANEALVTVVERMQREFLLSHDALPSAHIAQSGFRDRLRRSFARR